VPPPKTIVRDYGFGATPGTVKLGNTTLTVASWTDDLIMVNVPGNLSTGQLTIKRGDNSKESVVGLTVHVGGPAPIVVKPGESIQAVIDASTTPAGALISIPPGTYNEYVIADKRVRLQGWGANSVAINASKASAGGLAAWRELMAKKVDARCSLPNGNAGGAPNFVNYPGAGCPANTPVDADTGAATLVAGPNRTFDLLPGQTLGTNKANNEPILFGAEEGPGILALGRSQGNGCANAGVAFRIDGLTITGSDSGGGVLASGFNCNLQITNNRVVGNYGTYGGGVRVGHTALVNDAVYTSGVNSGVVVANNWISQNGASEIATGDGGGGGITMGTGSDAYRVSDNYVCGNFSMSDGGGVSHVGFSGGTSQILNNKILLNQTFNQSADPTGGGLFIGGQIALAGGTAEGSGNVTVDRNLIQYNHAGAGAGGGVSIVRTRNGNNANSRDDVLLTNNMIVNNNTAYAGGGVAVADVGSNVRLVNNTVADNVSTATNRQSFPAGQKVQSTRQIAGIARVSGSDPTLLNNIVSGNRAFTWSITPTNPGPGVVQTTALADTGVWDMGVVGSNGTTLPSTTSLVTGAAVTFVKPISVVALTDPDQPVVLPESTILQTALTFDEGGNFINVIQSPLTPWDLSNPATVRADYHITSASTAAIDQGTNRDNNGNNGNRVPTSDYDGQTRANTNANKVDIGADEIASSAVPTGTSTLAITAENGPGNLILGNTTLNFGNVGDNTVNTLTLTAGGSAPSVIGQASVTTTFSTSPLGATRFFFGTDTCSNTTLNPGSACTIQIRFNGAGGGFFGNPATGALSVPSSSPNSPTGLALIGN
jgi:hypothetical protein